MTTPRTPIDQNPATPLTDRLATLKNLFPEAFMDGMFDAARLRESLDQPDSQPPERFIFSWAGKREAASLLERPSQSALLPDEQESDTWDAAPNVFVEGDNLEVLQLLYKSYFRQVKLIYIDPPYNTGSDFVYPDDYRDRRQNYLLQTGQVDEAGNATSSKRETSGRVHSGWLSMMYPRLFLAKQLLKPDGVIMVSIDDHEQHHLRLLMNEVFGEENFIAQLVWDKTRKNDAKLFSVGHEYILVYARSLAHLKEAGTVWRESKPGAREILEFYRELQKLHEEDKDYASMETKLKAWYRDLPTDHPSKRLSRYRHIDKYGPWRDRDISWPGDGGPRYDVLHDVTLKPVRVPDAGWRFSTPEAMQRQIDLGLVVFRADESEPPFRKAHLIPLPEELDEELPGEEVPDDEGEEGSEGQEAVGLQVMPSYLYAQAQVSVKALKALMGTKVFDNPKDPAVLARLIRYVTVPGEEDLVLDFFAGSGSTAEAVLLANREDGGKRRYVLVQLPQSTARRSAARKEGYTDIAQLTRERLRRTVAAHRVTAEAAGKARDAVPGFRAFKMAPSQVRSWSGGTQDSYDERLAAMLDPLLPGWSPEGVLWELAVREGFPLTAQTQTLQVLENTVRHIEQNGRTGRLFLCLDAHLSPKLLTELRLTEADLFICRDVALTDELASNFTLQHRIKVI